MLDRILNRLNLLSQRANAKGLNSVQVQFETFGKDLVKLSKDVKDLEAAAFDNVIRFIDQTLETYFNPPLADPKAREKVLDNIFTLNSAIIPEVKKMTGMVNAIKESMDLNKKIEEEMRKEDLAADTQEKRNAFEQIRVKAYRELKEEEVKILAAIRKMTQDKQLALDLMMAFNRKKAEFLKAQFGVKTANQSTPATDKKTSESRDNLFAGIADMFKLFKDPNAKDALSRGKSFFGAVIGFIIDIFSRLFKGFLGKENAEKVDAFAGMAKEKLTKTLFEGADRATKTADATPKAKTSARREAPSAAASSTPAPASSGWTSWIPSPIKTAFNKAKSWFGYGDTSTAKPTPELDVEEEFDLDASTSSYAPSSVSSAASLDTGASPLLFSQDSLRSSTSSFGDDSDLDDDAEFVDALEAQPEAAQPKKSSWWPF
jgi:hypothetical protein